MKHVLLKLVQLLDDDGKPIVATAPDGTQVPATLDYRKQLIATVKEPLEPAKGMDAEEIHATLRILKVLKASELQKGCELDEADHALLVKKVKTQRWKAAIPEIEQFIADIVGA